MVANKNKVDDSNNPTLLYGYGGFEVPVTPFYASTFGIGWLDKGGVFVFANISGGEFGPKWHQDGMKEQKNPEL